MNTNPAPVLKVIFVRLLLAEVDDLKHRMNEAMHKLKKKPCKKSEKGLCITLYVFKVNSRGYIELAEVNYIFTASAVTNRVTLVDTLKTDN